MGAIADAHDPLTITHHPGDAVTLAYGATTLFRYVYAPDTAARESPKPYFHPIHTLAGHLVTDYRPPDHVWHTGVCMTLVSVSGENFWGGPTYVHGSGYVQRDNHGRQVHQAWLRIECDARSAALTERLRWVSQAGETLLTEEREIAVSAVDAVAGWYALDFTSRLTNATERTLHLGSPTTEGRPLAGYGSLFWRGPQAFRGGAVLAAGGAGGPEMMGERSPWLAYIEQHDGGDGGNGASATLLFRDHPDNPRYPTPWYVRNDPFAAVSFAFVFDAQYPLLPEQMITLRYRIVIADSAWTRERIEAHVAAAE